MKNFLHFFSKAFWITAVLGVAGFLALAGINLGMINSAKPHIITVEEAGTNGDYDCILVLGARVYSSGSLSPMLEDRVKYGIMCYEAGAAPRLLLSGDHGQKEYDEVNAMKQYCVNRGIDPDVIFLDHAGFNTYDSMQRARDVYVSEDTSRPKRILIVTQEFHLSRAIYIARSLGLEADGVPSDPQPYGTWIHDTIREFMARVKAFAYCIIKPPSTPHYGEPISFAGPASASDDREYT